MRRCLIVVAAVAGMFVATAPGAEPRRKPNVVVILADDLGYADIGVQGIAKDVKTPNIDSIARDGVRFTNGYVSCPVCSPSRAGLLTGRYQTRFGHELNPGGVDFPNFGLPLSEVTLADVMRRAGYKTGMLGKWHLGNTEDRAPTARGFEEFFGFWGGMHGYMGQSPGWNMIRRGTQRVEGKIPYLTDAIGDEGAAFVEKHKDEPFFLYVAFNAVHVPQQVTTEYEKRFADVTDKKRRMMLAMLSSLDDAVGKVLGKLRENHLDEDTLVFFLSDNGGPTDGNASSNAPLSGYKGQLFEGGIREPFMVRWTGHVPGGKVVDAPVISLDIFSTAVAVSGAEGPKDRPIDGVDLTPWLAGKNQGQVHEQLCWRYGGQWAIREGDWKVVGYKSRAKLFDLGKDVGETTDLAEKEPTKLAKMKDDYAAWEKGMIKPLWVPPNEDMDDVCFDKQGKESVQGMQRRLGKKGGAD